MLGLATQFGGSKSGNPRISSWGAQRLLAVRGADVLADGVALEAMDPAFALFEVSGVGGQVPVDKGMAPPVQSRFPLGRWTLTQGPSARTAS